VHTPRVIIATLWAYGYEGGYDEHGKVADTRTAAQFENLPVLPHQGIAGSFLRDFGKIIRKLCNNCLAEMH